MNAPAATLARSLVCLTPVIAGFGLVMAVAAPAAAAPPASFPAARGAQVTTATATPRLVVWTATPDPLATAITARTATAAHATAIADRATATSALATNTAIAATAVAARATGEAARGTALALGTELPLPTDPPFVSYVESTSPPPGGGETGIPTGAGALDAPAAATAAAGTLTADQAASLGSREAMWARFGSPWEGRPLLERLVHGKPGLLGWPGTYIALIVAFVAAAVLVFRSLAAIDDPPGGPG